MHFIFKISKQCINKIWPTLSIKDSWSKFSFPDADLVAGDGIYSRFITRYFGAGRYAFIVHVNDNNQVWFVMSFTLIENLSRPKLSADLEQPRFIFSLPIFRPPIPFETREKRLWMMDPSSLTAMEVWLTSTAKITFLLENFPDLKGAQSFTLSLSQPQTRRMSCPQRE